MESSHSENPTKFRSSFRAHRQHPTNTCFGLFLKLLILMSLAASHMNFLKVKGYNFLLLLLLVFCMEMQNRFSSLVYVVLTCWRGVVLVVDLGNFAKNPKSYQN